MEVNNVTRLYTNIPQDSLIAALCELVNAISYFRKAVNMTLFPPTKDKYGIASLDDCKAILLATFENTYVQLGGSVYHQQIGIPRMA